MYDFPEKPFPSTKPRMKMFSSLPRHCRRHVISADTSGLLLGFPSRNYPRNSEVVLHGVVIAKRGPPPDSPGT